MPAPATILIVEDHPAVRSAVRAMLTRDGYQVLEAVDAVEAVRLVEQGQPPIDVAVVDVVLPPPGSPVVVEALRERGTPLRVILMSAYDRSALQRRPDVAALLFAGGVRFLEKPFSLRDLSAAIAELLAAPDGRVQLVRTDEWPMPEP